MSHRRDFLWLERWNQDGASFSVPSMSTFLPSQHKLGFTCFCDVCSSVKSWCMWPTNIPSCSTFTLFPCSVSLWFHFHFVLFFSVDDNIWLKVRIVTAVAMPSSGSRNPVGGANKHEISTAAKDAIFILTVLHDVDLYIYKNKEDIAPLPPDSLQQTFSLFFFCLFPWFLK